MGAKLVVLSGGQDSTTCLHWAIRESGVDNVHAVSYDYGQRHECELNAAQNVAYHAGIASRHVIVDIGPILQGTSPLIDAKARLEQYSNMFCLPGGLEKTFVPGRNMLFATLAANHAYVRGINEIVMGVCEEDYGGYPDCRETFISSLETTIRAGFGYDANDAFSEFVIHTPLMHLTKAETVDLAFSMPKCWEALALTHTAYDGKYPPTGNDHATLLRAKGFLEAGKPDPLVLRAHAEGLMLLPNTSNYTTRA